MQLAVVAGHGPVGRISRLAEVSGAVEAAAKQAKAAEARAREVREELEAAVQAQRRGDGRLAQVGGPAVLWRPPQMGCIWGRKHNGTHRSGFTSIPQPTLLHVLFAL